MTLHVNTLTIDSRDPSTAAAWWAETLDWSVIQDDGNEALIAPGRKPGDVPGAIPFLFLAVGEEKSGKNRLHLDLVPDDQTEAVERLIERGATRVDIGQRDVSWIVMADPEGNEFCVLRSYES